MLAQDPGSNGRHVPFSRERSSGQNENKLAFCPLLAHDGQALSLFAGQGIGGTVGKWPGKNYYRACTKSQEEETETAER